LILKGAGFDSFGVSLSSANRSSPRASNTLLKRDGGFASQDAAKTAGRADAKKIKNSRQPGALGVGTLKVGHNTEKPTR
jgi:hypothetical protein